MVRSPKDVVLVKRAVPKEVALPNGRQFTAIYKTATRAPLPAKATHKQKASLERYPTTSPFPKIDKFK